MKPGLFLVVCACMVFFAVADANAANSSRSTGTERTATVTTGTQIACVDGDGGFNSKVRGSATGCHTDSEGETVCGTYADTCISAEYAQEVMCKDGKITFGDYFCDTGLVCNAGACVTPQAAAASKSCVDSDNGADLSVKATVTGCHYWDAEQGMVCGDYVDKCDQWSNNPTKYFCEYGDVTWNSYPCTEKSVCSDGKCVKCSETDAGAYMFGIGYTNGIYNSTKLHQQKGDYCVDNKTVYEYYCGKDGYVYEAKMLCNTGYTCISGECVKTGATCASEGQSCDGAVCCKDLTCTKIGGGAICKSSITAQIVQAVKGLTNTTSGKGTDKASSTILGLGDLPPNSMSGSISMDDAGDIYLAKFYGFGGMHYVTVYAKKNGKSKVEGTLNGFYQSLDAYYLTLKIDNGAEAIALYGELSKLGQNDYLAFVSEECTYQPDNTVSCIVGNGLSDAFQIRRGAS